MHHIQFKRESWDTEALLKAIKNVKVEVALLEIKEINNLTWMDVQWMKTAGEHSHFDEISGTLQISNFHF